MMISTLLMVLVPWRKVRARGDVKLISEILLSFSVISAIVAALGRSPVQIRFGLAFLGLFSSLVAYLNESNAAGLFLLFTSCVLTPYPVSELANKQRRTRNSLSLQLFVVVAYVVCALAISALVGFNSIGAGLAALASVGLVAFTLKGSWFLDPVGWLSISQAILVGSSLINEPAWVVTCSDFCRWGCITWVWFSKRRR